MLKQPNQQQDNLTHLVELSIGGDGKAFEELCRIKGDSITRYCTNLMGNYADGQDMAQEVFIRLCKSIHTLKNPKAFSSWLNRLITNTCYSAGRKKSKRSPALPLDEVNSMLFETKAEMMPQEHLSKCQQKQMIHEAISAMPAKMQKCVVLYYFEDMPTKDISESLGINEASVNQQLYRARLKLRAESEMLTA